MVSVPPPAGALVGGCGQGDARYLRETFSEDAQLLVFRAEIVSPLADAMRFINRKQGRIDPPQQTEETFRQQAFGRDIEHVQLPGQQRLLHLPLFGNGQRAVEESRLHPQLPQGIHLILHQGNQRRDDDACTVTQQCRNLVTETFAAAGGHQHQGVAAFREGEDDFLLVAAKMVVTEDAGEDFEGAGREIGHVGGTILGFVNGLLNDTEHTLALMKDLQVAETDDPESKAGKAGIALPVIGPIVGPKMLVSVQLKSNTKAGS